MKTLLFLLCSLSYGFIMAQDCTRHLLMQKGVQLEYKEYVYRSVTSFNKDSGFFPVLRLLYNVSEVKDSAGSTFSAIIKKGVGIKDTNDHYERKIVLQCDGHRLLLPYDLYESDTLYSRDWYPPGIQPEKHGWAWAYTPMDNVITYVVPLVMDCITGLPEGKKQFERNSRRGVCPILICKNSYRHIYNIKSIALEGKVMVTTPAGTFSCYKFYVDEEVSYSEPTAVNYWLYFNEEIGLVKMESAHYKGYYTELTSIRK